ncbi:hypothetical protein PIB30_025474 [Stylosanthes scabra]|uniref:Uncharacterized protein n=1 Tax=Stylosanthes scabra TaxID=79078 RepID=A0ABU6WA35_9FABA|nr:hypothetical protein [Stylosanthes scabra]
MAALHCPHDGIVISTATEKLPQPCLSSTSLSNSYLPPSSSQTSNGGEHQRQRLSLLLRRWRSRMTKAPSPSCTTALFSFPLFSSLRQIPIA